MHYVVRCAICDDAMQISAIEIHFPIQQIERDNEHEADGTVYLLLYWKICYWGETGTVKKDTGNTMDALEMWLYRRIWKV